MSPRISGGPLFFLLHRFKLFPPTPNCYLHGNPPFIPSGDSGSYPGVSSQVTEGLSLRQVWTGRRKDSNLLIREEGMVPIKTWTRGNWEGTHTPESHTGRGFFTNEIRGTSSSLLLVVHCYGKNKVTSRPQISLEKGLFRPFRPNGMSKVRQGHFGVGWAFGGETARTRT